MKITISFRNKRGNATHVFDIAIRYTYNLIQTMFFYYAGDSRPTSIIHDNKVELPFIIYKLNIICVSLDYFFIYGISKIIFILNFALEKQRCHAKEWLPSIDFDR